MAQKCQGRGGLNPVLTTIVSIAVIFMAGIISASRGILRAMDFFETVTTQRAMRRLKPDPIPDAVLRQIMDATICAPSGGNRQGWSFLVIRDTAKRARLGELYREAWAELMKTPYYRGASAAPSDSPEGKMVASARHLAEHLGEAPVLVLACIGTAGAGPTITTGASIYPAVQNLMLAARALGDGSCITQVHKY